MKRNPLIWFLIGLGLLSQKCAPKAPEATSEAPIAKNPTLPLLEVPIGVPSSPGVYIQLGQKQYVIYGDEVKQVPVPLDAARQKGYGGEIEFHVAPEVSPVLIPLGGATEAVVHDTRKLTYNGGMYLLHVSAGPVASQIADSLYEWRDSLWVPQVPEVVRPIEGQPGVFRRTFAAKPGTYMYLQYRKERINTSPNLSTKLDPSALYFTLVN